MPLTGQGGQSGGPQYGWGGVGNDPSAGARAGSAGSRTNFNSGLNSGRYTAGPEAGMRRGAWQWSGHGPSAQRDYGWDYQGGVGRDEIVMRGEARDGGSYLSHMAQDRSGGLPRYSQDYDIGDRSLRGAGGYAQDYDRGFRGGHVGGRSQGDDQGFRAGGTLGGSGNRTGGGEYDQGFRAAGGATFGSGNRYGRDTGFRGDLAPAFGGQYGVGNEFADRYDRELRARNGHGFGGGQYDDGYRATGGLGYGSGNRTGGQYDNGYRATGGHTLGSGASPRHGAGFGGGYGGQTNRGGYQEVTYGFGPRQSSGGYEARPSGGYAAGGGGGQRGGYGREFGQGSALGGRGGGYDAGYSARPLTDDEFYSRVNRW